jgi:glycosyltransferase involved in cell wall biosynthesis
LEAHNLIHKAVGHLHDADASQYALEAQVPLIGISESHQRISKAKGYNMVGYVYHGLDPGAYKFTANPYPFLCWIGRFDPEKGPGRAIKIAKMVGIPLIMAGSIHSQRHKEIFDGLRSEIVDLSDQGLEILQVIRNMSPEDVPGYLERLSPSGLPIFVGLANEEMKQVLFSCLVTIFGISWPEPFGRVMIESMAVGTPVVGTAQLGGIDCGAVREIITDGCSGFAVEAADEEALIELMSKAVLEAIDIDREAVYREFLARWTSWANAKALGEFFKSFFER